MNIIDVLVHIRTQLDTDQRNIVEGELRELDGIIAPRFSENKNHLMMVAYNPAKVSSGGLLNKFTSMGLDADLIGM